MPQISVLKFFLLRCNEPVKFFPVIFVTSIIALLWLIYHFFHVRVEHPARWATVGKERADVEVSIFTVSATLLAICYVKCILVHPGTIPDTADWQLSVSPEDGGMPPQSQETKRSGERRSCKWCAKYKPDRCHHCRVCRMCILRMDHHCPWIYNCVGFGNHKFFFLFIFYSAVCSNIIVWTMKDSLSVAIGEEETPFMTMFLLLFGESLAALIAGAVSLFFLLHVYLMLYATTTIEFCEKAMKRTSYDTSTYDRGYLENIRAVLGEWTVLWFLPVSPPPLALVLPERREDDFSRLGGPDVSQPPARVAGWSGSHAGLPSSGEVQRRPGAGTGSAPGSGHGSGSDEDTRNEQGDVGSQTGPVRGMRQEASDPFLPSLPR